jgi:hypothetical protein
MSQLVAPMPLSAEKGLHGKTRFRANRPPVSNPPEREVGVGENWPVPGDVFYEIGFAHALGKPTILLAASGDDLKAFDTAGFRHFLHDGNPETARRLLFEVLPAIEHQISVQPAVPDATILYEWPSATDPAPGFNWRSQNPERHLQIDLGGGQRIIETVGLGQLISISNTKEFWNHRPGYSIMRLALTTDLSVGDTVHLLLEGRCSGAGLLDFVGDGGWVETQQGRKFSQPWKEQHRAIGATVAWTRWMFTTTVSPAPPEYDLSRGIAIYLLTKVEKAAILLKQIRLLRRRVQ